MINYLFCDSRFTIELNLKSISLSFFFSDLSDFKFTQLASVLCLAEYFLIRYHNHEVMSVG